METRKQGLDWSELIRIAKKHANSLRYRLSVADILSIEDSEDIAQESLLRAWNSGADDMKEAKIVIYKSNYGRIGHISKLYEKWTLSTDAGAEEGIEYDTSFMTQGFADPEKAMLANDTLDRIRKENPRIYRILALEAQGYKRFEIAGQLGIAESTITRNKQRWYKEG